MFGRNLSDLPFFGDDTVVCMHAHPNLRRCETGCRIGAKHCDTLNCTVHSQTKLEPTVRSQCVTYRTGGTLRGNDEVHAEGSTSGRNINESGVEFRMLIDQCRELIHHDDESREPNSSVEL